MNLFSYKHHLFDNKKELMGLAIILIICYHSQVGDFINNIRPLHFVKELCDIGVEIFLLLSGFSLAVSLSKDGNILSFYKKRVVRLLPAYFIVFSLWYAFLWLKDGGSIGQYLWNLFFLNYYIDKGLIVWFIPVILLYYLLMPFYVKAVHKSKYAILLPYFIIALDLILLAYHINPTFTLLRYPIFLIGANFYLSKESECNSSKGILGMVALSCATIAGLALSYYCIFIDNDVYGYKYFGYIPFALLIVRCFWKSSNSALLCFMGGITLEVYLLHERIQWLFDAVQFKVFPKLPLWIFCLGAIVTTIIVDYYLNKFVAKITSK